MTAPKLPGVPSVELIADKRERMVSRPYVTAKGYRALGIPIPPSIPDDAVIDLHIEAGGEAGTRLDTVTVSHSPATSEAAA